MTPVCCPKCASPFVLPETVAARSVTRCARCSTLVELEVFPALRRGPEVGAAGEAALPDEAACFAHAEKRAEAACDQCGRYMCALCRIRVGSRALCPVCFDGGARGKSEVKAVRFRMLFAHVGALVAIASLALGLFAFVGAPFAIALGLLGLIRRDSVTGRRTILAAVVAISLGLLEGLLFFAIFGRGFFAH